MTDRGWIDPLFARPKRTRGKPIGQEERNTVAAMLHAGATNREIASHLNRPQGTIAALASHAIAAGLAPRRKPTGGRRVNPSTASAPRGGTAPE